MSENFSKILITGANGFIGSALIKTLLKKHMYEIVAAYKKLPATTPKDISVYETGSLCNKIDWTPALVDTDAIIHLAGRGHIPNGNSKQAYEDFHRINVEAATELAYQAIKHRVSRFIYVSSIAVNGICNEIPISEEDEPNPTSDYGISKYRAEQELTQLCSNSDMELVVVRPPLVYGANAPGNFKRLHKLASLPLPLPFERIDNKRSLISITNLVDFLICIISHPNAANQLFLISDNEYASTGEIVSMMRRGIGKPARLFYAPPIFWELLELFPGISSVTTKLCGNYQLNSSKAQLLLEWEPPQTLEQGLLEAMLKNR